MKRKFVVITLILALVIGSFTTMSFGASGTKKMKVYNVVKKGNTVYCAAANGIYKVNLKNKKVKRFVKAFCPVSLTIKDGYLYYTESGGLTVDYLNRVKLKNGKKQRLFCAKKMSDPINYAISGNKIYTSYVKFTDPDYEHTRLVCNVMKKNGKSRRTSSYKVKNKYKNSNAKGYSLIIKEDFHKTPEYYTDYYYIYYLKTPKGKIYICKLDISDYAL